MSFTRSVRCTHDTMLWDTTIRGNVTLMCEFLTHKNGHGVLHNITKFVFCQLKLDYVGFTVHPQRVAPSVKYLNSIKAFPAPEDITGV